MTGDAVMGTDLAPRLDRLRRLLGSEVGKFGHYQELPVAAIGRCPELAGIGYENRGHIPLDGPRCRWLLDNIDVAGLSVVEVGANIGYFALSLADAGAERVRAYEPLPAFSEACALLTGLCGLEERLFSINAGLALDDVETLPETDLVIMLNVMHHAGTVFDQGAVAAGGGWQAYALDYLRRLAGRARRLFFQIGNTARGEALFPGRETLPYTHALLTAAGWRVDRVAVVDDFETLSLRTVDGDDIDALPRLWCHRNDDSGLVDYLDHTGVVASLATGMAQRPLWLCSRAAGGTS
jgi:hypothetical protein